MFHDEWLRFPPLDVVFQAGGPTLGGMGANPRLCDPSRVGGDV